MTLIDVFRYWFVAAFMLGLAVFAASILGFRRRSPQIVRSVGLLPPPPALLTWLIPPIILLAGIGGLPQRWLAIRLIGAGLSVYALIMMVWATTVLGRNYAPGPAILADQRVISSGPYRMLRHPIYSAVLALWVGSVLGTLNWVLLVVCPFVVVGVTKQARQEEQLLREDFGPAYEEYARARGGLVPGPGSR